jgi:hypothetical protein
MDTAVALQVTFLEEIWSKSGGTGSVGVASGVVTGLEMGGTGRDGLGVVSGVVAAVCFVLQRKWHQFTMTQEQVNGNNRYNTSKSSNELNMTRILSIRSMSCHID